MRDCEHEARKSRLIIHVPLHTRTWFNEKEGTEPSQKKHTSIPGLPRANAGLCTGSRLLYLSDLNPALYFYVSNLLYSTI
jgi:hypothetical protein